MLALAREMMPFFFGTRRLDISKLDQKPPDNMKDIRDILYMSTRDVLDKLKKKEQMYYGYNRDAVTELSKWSTSVSAVISSAYLTHLSGAWQLDYILTRAADPKMKFDADIHHINKTRECYRRLKDAVPNKFLDLLEDINTISKHLQKYLLSFYCIDSEEQATVRLDTAAAYEQHRQHYITTIKQQAQYIHTLCSKLNSNVILSDMSVYTRELARKCDCTHLPLILVFPEACETIRFICKTIMEWLDDDSNYATFIANDVRTLKTRRKEQEMMLRDAQHKYHQLHFKLTRKQTACQNVRAELEKLHERESDCIIDEEMTISRANAMQVEVEMKEYRRDELMKHQDALHPDLMKEKQELSDHIRDLRLRLPAVMRQALAFRNKIEWIAQRKEEIHMSIAELKDLQNLTDSVHENMILLEEDVRKTVAQLTMAKQILLYKSSNDAPSKIFYEQAVRSNRSKLHGWLEGDDPFDRACRVCIHMVQHSWPAFYRALAFHPQRGETMIDQDILELTQMSARTSTAEVVEKVLIKWRRHNTRPTLEELKDALAAIKRFDILEKIDLELNPPKPEEVHEENLYPYAQPHMIPFLKEVERFDELQKMNKA